MTDDKKQCYECVHNFICPIKKGIKKIEREEQRFTKDSQFYEDLAVYCLLYYNEETKES